MVEPRFQAHVGPRSLPICFQIGDGKSSPPQAAGTHRMYTTVAFALAYRYSYWQW